MIAVGDRVPPNIFRELGPVGPETVSSDTLFAGRRVVLFSCPGAFALKAVNSTCLAILHVLTKYLPRGSTKYYAYLSTIPS